MDGTNAAPNSSGAGGRWRRRQTDSVVAQELPLPSAHSDMTDDPFAIRGEGKYAGKPPRSAGIIAFCDLEDEPHVCICEKRNGNVSFPKGGKNPGENVLQNALREWREEAGIASERLKLFPDVSFDEPNIGCRYLVARCVQPEAGSQEPDVGCTTWRPPAEDPNDRDPIIRSSWLSLASVLAGGSNLSAHRKHMLRRAAAASSVHVGDSKRSSAGAAPPREGNAEQPPKGLELAWVPQNLVERVRAVQGWSQDVGAVVEDSVAMQEIRSNRELEQLGFICCHGTWLESWKIIKVQGLNRMTRKHIHFTCHLPAMGEVISGMRMCCEVLVFLDVPKFLAAGGQLFRSKNNVLLSSGFNGVIPPDFFKQAVQQLPKRGQLWPERGQARHVPGMSVPAMPSGIYVPPPTPLSNVVKSKRRLQKSDPPLAKDKHAKADTRFVTAPPAEVNDKMLKRPTEAEVVSDSWEDDLVEPVEQALMAKDKDAEIATQFVTESPVEVNDKRLKRLAKLLASIERLEERQKQGHDLTKEELDKLRRKPDILDEMSAACRG